MASSASAYFVSSVFAGIYYAGNPTITLNSCVTTQNYGNSTQVGATSWTTLDGDGNTVATGTCNTTDTSITVATNGVWSSGGTVLPGYYLVYTASGTQGIVSGAFCVCPANSNMYVPTANDNSNYALAAWIGSSCDRDNYSIGNSGDPGLASTPNTISTRQNDNYFIGPQDSARPRQFWCAPYKQASYSSPDPTPSTYSSYASAFQSAGYTGVVWECPTNEPENGGGWSMSTLISQTQAIQSAVKAVDSTAKFIGWDCAGLPGPYGTDFQPITAYIQGCSPDGISYHVENSNYNKPNLHGLIDLIGSIDNAMVAAGTPNMDLWLTETGIDEGLYQVFHVRRGPRQRCLLRFVMEMYGHPKEQCYDFPIVDHTGSGLGTFMVGTGAAGKVLRPGAYALHVMAEALWGTSCSRTNRPVQLNFGDNTYTPGGGLFAGLYYGGTTKDVVVIATNGLESGSVTLNVSAANGTQITWWDGWGRSNTSTVTSGQITVGVNDLLTYVFLPTGTAVSVADTDQKVISQMNIGINMVPYANTVARGDGTNLAGTIATDGNWTQNTNSLPVSIAPVYRQTQTETIQFTLPSATEVAGFSFTTGSHPWQSSGSGLVSAQLQATVSGTQTTVWSWTCSSANTLNIPSPDSGNSSDFCSHTTFWTHPFSLAESFNPVVATDITFTFTVGYGGQPDSTGSALSENDPPRAYIAEFQVYSPPSRVLGAVSAPLLLRRL